VKLSNKKTKYIRRHAAKETPEAMAEHLGISVRDVQLVLSGSGGQVTHTIVSSLDQTLHLGLILVSFLAPFMILRGIYDFANLPQSAFVQVAVVFLFLIWLIKGFFDKACLIVKSPLNWPILAFVLWSLASLIYAHNKYEGFLPWMSWTACSLMFFLVVNGNHEAKRIAPLLTALFAAGCLSALLGISQHLFGFSWVPQVKPPSATFANRNMATQFIILTLPLAVGLIFSTGKTARVWIVALASGLMLSFLVYTRTRAGWVALLAEALLLAVLVLRERIQSKQATFWNRQKSLAAGSAVVILFLMMNLGPKGFKWGFREIAQETAAMTEFEEEGAEGQSLEARNVALRVAIWRNTIEMIKDRPWLGWGLGNHKVFYPLYHRRVVEEQAFSETAQLSHVHNDFLQAFAELGLVGMGLLAWLAVVLAVIVFRLTSSRYPDRVRFWTMGISVAMIGLLVNAFFSFPFQRAIPPFVFMIFIGALGSFYSGEHRTWFVLKKRWLILCAGVIVLVAWIWIIRLNTLGIVCDRHFMLMTQLEKAGQWSGVLSEGEKAFESNPSRTKVLSYIGRAYVETGRYEEGIKALEQVIKAYPCHMNALLNIGVAYGSMGDYEKALDAYDRVLKIKPDYGKVHNNMGNIYMKQKKLDEAVEEFQLAADLDPSNAIIHFNVGTAMAHAGRYEEAAEALEKAIELKPEWALAYKRLGALYLQYLHRESEGVDLLRKALELNPRMEDAESVRKLIDRVE
jgi:Tfp pilus assembly protein PilF/O-antigen ligase